MAVVPRRRPPTPSPSERARSVLARHGPATVTSTAADDEPMMLAETVRHAHADGAVSMLIDDGHPIVSTTQQVPNGLGVLTELPDIAPVALREPVRGLLWISGRLSVPTEADMRSRVLSMAEVDADERLLDVGHGVTMLLLRPTVAALVDGDGTHALDPEEFAGASPDPFSRWESAWLRHLDQKHPDVLQALSRHVPQRLRRGRLRPLGMDRFGLRLRVETDTGDHDIRLAFERPAQTQRDVSVEIRKLVGCPFLRRFG